MSEEILKALIQLFAIVAKQDYTRVDKDREFTSNFLTKQVQSYRVKAYLQLFDEKVEEGRPAEGSSQLTSVKDSVRILKICKKINKTLDHTQKVISLLRLLEMIEHTGQQNKQQNAIAETVADVFNIDKEEYKSLQTLVFESCKQTLDPNTFLRIYVEDSDSSEAPESFETAKNNIIFLKINSARLIFFKYCGNSSLFMNGLPIDSFTVNIFSVGSSLRHNHGKPIYYSDINDRFLRIFNQERITYQAYGLHYEFDNGTIGIENFNLSASENSLIGIMGASGSGKSTLLNLMSGISKPQKGDIYINGINLYDQADQLEGVIGFIPQDDLLIESLSVYENLYFNAQFCFRDKTKEEIRILAEQLLDQLGLAEIKDLKVGSPLNKKISGGQRKRLNIALELIREPSVLFVDEPTSGLSSKDSENVMNLLRELSLKGKIIFVVIHQPSSEIYKIFDRILMLDEGGLSISYSNPVDSIRYFRQIDGMAAFENVECPNCGNVNPEQLFNIVQAKEIDEYGRYTKERKRKPQDWYKLYQQKEEIKVLEKELSAPPKSLHIPKKKRQWWIYLKRDFISKIRNTQYLLIALLEAPVLAFILSYLIRYIPEGNEYLFRQNENIPHYIFMMVIVSLFLGMTLSAEEIFKDRKILKREAFLNLSKTSYLLAKLSVLVILSATQAFLFVLIGNWISAIEGMLFAYWFAFFTVSVFSNILGLVISSAFDEVVTIYIIIPLMLIPQMILGGAMFSFNKLNKSLVRMDKVPIVAEMMASKWAYEGLVVQQFKNNRFEREFFDLQQAESQADYYQVYYVPELEKVLNQTQQALTEDSLVEEDCALLAYEADKQNKILRKDVFTHLEDWKEGRINANMIAEYSDGIAELSRHYNLRYQIANNEKEAFLKSIFSNQENKAKYYYLRDRYANESLEDLVRKKFEKHKIVRYNNTFVQNMEPIYQLPVVNNGWDFRSHLFAPKKHIFGRYFETLYFNMSIIWLMSFVLFVILRMDLLRKLLDRTKYFEHFFSFSKKQKHEK